MSRFVIYIELEPFVTQWLVHSFGNPVVFPAQSPENSTIRRFTMKMPADKLPEKQTEKSVAICIPDSKSKDPMTFNYLGVHGKEAVAECIEDLFRRNMWSELNDLSDCGCSVMKAIYSWCEMHNIDIDYANTVRQRYYRIREFYSRKNCSLMKTKRNRDE